MEIVSTHITARRSRIRTSPREFFGESGSRIAVPIPATLALYGIGDHATEDFGKECLLARRFAEAGVRYIEVCHAGWDQHQNLKTAITKNCVETDRPIAALLSDLKSRGLLQDTLVMWGGEFGRTPDSRKADWRDHNAKGYTMWMACGGVRGGLSYGGTDDYGYKAVENPTHEKLTYRYAGRDFRLTDVHGRAAKEIFA